MPVRKTAAIVLLGLLAGCPQDTGAPPKRLDAVPADLAHVKVGQKYCYRMLKKGQTLEMVWEVDAITATEVKYTLRMRAESKRWVAPVSRTWPIPVPVAADAIPVETIQAGGRQWDCWIRTRDLSEGERKTWIPQKNGMGTFPPYVKQTLDGEVTAELLKIE